MEQVLTRTDAPSAHKRYGDALALAKRYDDAMKQYDIALKIDARFLPALNEKGFLLIKRYVDGLDLDDALRLRAIEMWRSSLTINPNQPRIADAIKKWEKPGLFGN
jgi:tetratricopeptide (TPR) repeat protein